jgi:MFS family permease
LLDRLGKGVRTSPRDALLAASAPAAHRGKVFGFHRAMDTLGAVAGPLLAIWLLSISGNDYRFVFLIAVIPTALAFLLTFAVKEIRSHPYALATKDDKTDYWLLITDYLPSTYWKFLVINAIFFLGNSSDVFLILRAKELGLSATLVILAYVLYNGAFALFAAPAGILSDRLGRRRIMQAGFLIYALVYAGFAFATSTLWIWPLFGLYGFYAAMTEGVSKAAIADVVAPEHRGSAIGIFYMITGSAMLVASSLAGWLWKELGAPAALGFSSALSMLAFFLLFGYRETTIQR